VIPLYRRRESALRYLRRRGDARRFEIMRRDLVADIGSGQDPHPRANVLCDKFLVDTTERSCGADVHVDRPVVVCDATRTPFPDKTFDFVYCAHLLEHMKEPAGLLDELQRIGHRGYVETPSPAYEKIRGWSFHRWYVSVEGSRLVLESKDRIIFDDELHRWFESYEQARPFWQLFIARVAEYGLLTAYRWDGSIRYEVRGVANPAFDSFTAGGSGAAQVGTANSDGATTGVTRLQRAKSRLDRLGRWASDRRLPEILEHLWCPECRIPLDAQTDPRSCPRCGAACSVEGHAYTFE
jgi:hypothetical protein